MRDDLCWEIEERPDATLVRVSGELDDVGAGYQLQQELKRCVVEAHEGALIVVDLAAVSCLTNDGRTVLFAPLVRARQRGVRLCLAAVPSQALRRLEAVGLDRFFPIYESVEAALAKKSPGEPDREQG